MCLGRISLEFSENVLSCELRTAGGIDGRIMRVRDDQRELCTSVPALPQIGGGIIEVDGGCVIWGSVRIAGWEEKYSPEQGFRLRE